MAFEFSLPGQPIPDYMQRCRQRNEFTDIIIKVGKEEYPAHKIVLQQSPLMSVWFTDPWKRDEVYEWNERYVDSEVVEDVLTFLYTSRVTITTKNMLALCIASHFLEIYSLMEASELFLSQQVIYKNALDWFLLSEKLNLEVLRMSCGDCVVENYETLLRDNKVLAYGLEEFKSLIKEIGGRNGNSRMKEVLFECLMSWIEKDRLDRSSSLPSLMRLLPVMQFSLQFLRESVAMNSDVVAKLKPHIQQQQEHTMVEFTFGIIVNMKCNFY